MSPHLLLLNSISATLSIPHLFPDLPDSAANYQTCFAIEVTAAELTASLCSISQENFGNSLMLNSRADVAASIAGMCWREIQGYFYAGADTDKGTGSFLCFHPLQKISQVYSLLCKLSQKLPEK